MQIHPFIPPGFSKPSQAWETSDKDEPEHKEDGKLTDKKRNPGRRGKGNKRNKRKHDIDLKIIHSNIDGYKSKKESVNEIAEKETPDIITLNDTNLKGKLKVKVPNYFSYNKNREKYKGGVAPVIANHLKHNTMKVTEGIEDDEYIVTRLDNTIPAVNVINIYGQQESRTSDSDIEKSWLRLLKVIEEIEERNEALLLIGDMNRQIGNDIYGIKGNKSKISFGGKLIRNMVKDGLYVVINNLDLVVGGPWTWVDRQDSNRKSCLDIAIISQSLIPYLTKVVIDADRKFTPRRVIKKKKETMTIFSDHFALKI